MAETPPIVPGAAPTPPAPDSPPPESHEARALAPARSGPRWLVPALGVVTILAVGTAVFFALGGPDRIGGGQSATGSASLSRSPTGQVATVGQYAGVVNAAAGDYAETWSEFSIQCLVPPTLDDPLCQLKMLGLDANANTIALSLTGAAKPGVPAYIGAPPAEIEKLVADTTAAAQVVADVITDDTTANPGELFAAGNRLEDVLERWEPYL
jgi:hypothetical protein